MSLPWVRLHTSFGDSPEVLSIMRHRDGGRTLAVHLFAVLWCARNDTEGFLPGAALSDVHGRPKDARRLVSEGLWCPLSADWHINDWDMWAPLPRRAHIPLEIRRAVYERDGHRCLACGATESLSLDHIVPWSQGGADTIENLRTLCKPCNSTRRARTDLEWLGVEL